MKLIIRDDDLSYFAKPKELERLYNNIWDKCPISFSIIPFVNTKGFETPLNVTKKGGLFAIGDNKQLVTFLKQKIKEKKITIVQHGYSHQDYGDLHELERRNEKQIYKELKKGKEYLEKLFGIKINTLVAPHDRFSKEAIKAAEKVGYKYICRAFAPMPREIQFNKKYVFGFWKLFKFWLKYKKKFRYPFPINFGQHKEVFSYRTNEIINHFYEVTKFHKKYKKGLLSVTTHYRGVDLHTKELLQELIKMAEHVTHLNKL